MSENRNHLAGIVFGVASIAMFLMVVFYLYPIVRLAFNKWKMNITSPITL